MSDERPTFVEHGGRYQVSGPLTFDTVLELVPMSADWSVQRGPLVVDLANVGRADSAGLALLVEWLRAAHAAGRPLTFAHVPRKLQTLIEVSDLAGVIPQAA